MLDFTFYSPTLFAFGDGAERDTGALVRRFGGRKVLLVYGGGSVKRNGAYDAVTASLKASGIPWAELSGVQPNPVSGKVYEGIDLCRREEADFLLALGGGSAIDTAKAIGFGAHYDGDFWDFFSRKAQIRRSLPVGAVLTIAAAGSEGSDSCVITQEEGGLKWGCPRTDAIRPVFAVLDPRLTFSLPPFQTACGVTDMLSHICERYFSRTPNVDLTGGLCESLMRTIVSAARRALADPEDYDARADLMWAGTLAHNNSCGVGREQDWASHQIEHELSARYGCAHGAGLAVVLPAWMEFVHERDPRLFARFAVEVMGCPSGDPLPTARAGIRALRDFLREMGMPSTLRELGMDEGRFDTEVEQMVAHRAQKPGGFPFGRFVPIGPDEMRAILALAR